MVFNVCVKTIEEIRYENFLILVEEAGNVARFAERMKKSYGQFSQIKNKSPESKTGKPKEIGSKQAREMEVVFGREIGWMDHESLDQEAQAFKKLPAEVRAWILKNAGVTTSIIPATKAVEQSQPIESQAERRVATETRKTDNPAPKRLADERRQREQDHHPERRKIPWDYKRMK